MCWGPLPEHSSQPHPPLVHFLRCEGHPGSCHPLGCLSAETRGDPGAWAACMSRASWDCGATSPLSRGQRTLSRRAESKHFPGCGGAWLSLPPSSQPGLGNCLGTAGWEATRLPQPRMGALPGHSHLRHTLRPKGTGRARSCGWRDGCGLRTSNRSTEVTVESHACRWVSKCLY